MDHVELFVPDRYLAAEWYSEILGLEILTEYEHWAEDAGGPLMISSDGGDTKLALFTGTPQGDRDTAGYHLVAFRVSGSEFMSFLARLPGLGLRNHTGQHVTMDLLADHQQAYSLYFNDPFGHRLELTTYDYEEIRNLLANPPRN